MEITVKLDDTRLRDLEENLIPRLSRVVRRSGFRVERSTKENAPVDLGYLRNTVFLVTDQGSGVAQARADAEATLTRAAKKKRGGKKAAAAVPERKFSDSADAVTVSGPLEVAVVVGAEYGAAVEYGPNGKPFLTPAVDKERPQMEKDIKAVMEGDKA